MHWKPYTYSRLVRKLLQGLRNENIHVKISLFLLLSNTLIMFFSSGATVIKVCHKKPGKVFKIFAILNSLTDFGFNVLTTLKRNH